jgi:CRISPR-associated protein Cas2
MFHLLSGGKMYYIIVYDVGVEKVAKVHRFLKRYLNWIQNSVFEGELGEADYMIVKRRIKEILDLETDSVLIFRFYEKNCEKEVIGRERNSTDTII